MIDRTLPRVMTDLFQAYGVKVDSVAENTMLSAARLVALFDAAHSVRDLPGESAEIGCANGGTTRLMATVLGNGGRRHWALDTFRGLQDCGPNDDLENRTFRGPTLTGVRRSLADLPQVHVIEGYFPECAPSEMVASKFRLVHIDVDTYSSVRNCFRFFSSRMVKGGLIAFDDVIGKGPRGSKKAWDEIDISRKAGWEVVSVQDPQVVVRRK